MVEKFPVVFCEVCQNMLKQVIIRKGATYNFCRMKVIQKSDVNSKPTKFQQGLKSIFSVGLCDHHQHQCARQNDFLIDSNRRDHKVVFGEETLNELEKPR